MVCPAPNWSDTSIQIYITWLKTRLSLRNWILLQCYMLKNDSLRVSVFRILVMCACVSFSHDRWHNASGPLSWHFDIFSKTNKSELCTAGIRFSLIFLGFRLCFWCTDEIGIGWYSLTCTVHTIENARNFF